MLGIRGKLLVGFFLILAFLAGLSAYVYVHVRDSGARAGQAVDQDFNASILLSRAVIEALALDGAERGFFREMGDAEQQDRSVHAFRGTADKLADLLAGVADDPVGAWTEQEKRELGQWLDAAQAYRQAFADAVRDLNNGVHRTGPAAEQAMDEARRHFKQGLQQARRIGDAKHDSARSASTRVKGQDEESMRVLLASAAAGLALCLVIMVVVSASVNRSIRNLVVAAHDISTGKLENAVPRAGSGELQELSESLERMRVAQKAMMERLRGRRRKTEPTRER